MTDQSRHIDDAIAEYLALSPEDRTHTYCEQLMARVMSAHDLEACDDIVLRLSDIDEGWDDVNNLSSGLIIHLTKQQRYDDARIRAECFYSEVDDTTVPMPVETIAAYTLIVKHAHSDERRAEFRELILDLIPSLTDDVDRILTYIQLYRAMNANSAEAVEQSSIDKAHRITERALNRAEYHVAAQGYLYIGMTVFSIDLINRAFSYGRKVDTPHFQAHLVDQLLIVLRHLPPHLADQFVDQMTDAGAQRLARQALARERPPTLLN